MLKIFYKSIVVSVLSGCLMLMNFNYKTGEIKFFVMDTVQAETLKTEGISDNNLMATLTMTSVGLLTSRLWSCKLTPDMLVAAGAGAAFIAGEVIATLKLKKIMEDLEMEIQRDIKGDINKEQIEAAKRTGAKVVELHTGSYAENPSHENLTAIINSAQYAHNLGLEVHAGHGLNYRNVAEIAAIPEIIELNIGHFLIGEAVFIGLKEAITQMRKIMNNSRK